MYSGDQFSKLCSKDGDVQNIQYTGSEVEREIF